LTHLFKEVRRGFQQLKGLEVKLTFYFESDFKFQRVLLFVRQDFSIFMEFSHEKVWNHILKV